MSSGSIIVVGAGVGGLTAAALLARAGFDVTVLEAHVYPGGCAGTFYHKGFRFDAGATLAGGFYPNGPMDVVAQAAGISQWPGHTSDPAMVVHLPDGATVTRWTGNRRWRERRQVFGLESESFWRWQERTADALWNLALRSRPGEVASVPPWPPQSPGQAAELVRHGLRWLADDPQHASLGLLADAFQPVAAQLRQASRRLRLFVDAQLLIAAQTTSAHANALYGASALDLPRRGVIHLQGGMGGIAQALAAAVEANGGRVRYRQEVTAIRMQAGQPAVVETKRGETLRAERIIANLPPWNIAPLLGEQLPRRLRRLPPRPEDGWGAFMLYVGLDSTAIPGGFPLHHQVVVREPLAEGNTVFLSLSPSWDGERAPQGQRALTASTHTQLGPWWDLYERDRAAYEERKNVYAKRMLAAAHRALPGVREAASLVMPGTPITFRRFTRRAWGWVGGFPQTSLFQAWPPRLAPGLWMVGDSIFPGQSTAAVALGGMRVAQAILREEGLDLKRQLSEQRRAPLAQPPVQHTEPVS